MAKAKKSAVPSNLPAKFSPRQIECLMALLGWTNTGNQLKIIGDRVDFCMGFGGRGNPKLSEVTVGYVYQICPAESDEMADAFKEECYFFKPDLTKKNAVRDCAKSWGDVVLPVLKYVE